MTRQKNNFWTLSWTKNSPMGPQKEKNDPKIKYKSKVRIEETIENKSCSTTWVDPKTVLELYPDPKNSSLGPKKVKNEPKIKSKSNVRIEGNMKNRKIASKLR